MTTIRFDGNNADEIRAMLGREYGVSVSTISLDMSPPILIDNMTISHDHTYWVIQNGWYVTKDDEGRVSTSREQP